MPKRFVYLLFFLLFASILSTVKLYMRVEGFPSFRGSAHLRSSDLYLTPSDLSSEILNQIKWNVRAEEGVGILQEMRTIRPAQPVMLHTEFNPFSDKSPCFKNRLVALSALATQPNATIYVWFWQEKSTDSDMRCFKDLMEHPTFSKQLHLKRYQPQEEVDKLVFLDQSARDQYLAAALGTNSAVLPNLSDLRRYLLLYNYGGTWLDTDVFLIQPMWVVAGLDYAYECPWRSYYFGQFQWKWLSYADTKINGAVMGASSPKSDFIRRCISRVVDILRSPGIDDYYIFAGSLFADIRSEAIELGLPSPFLSLPCSWFDTQWAQGSIPGAPSFKWERMFRWDGSNAHVPYNAADAVKVLSTEQVLAFHFHSASNWDVQVSDESFSVEFTRHYERLLRLPPSPISS